MSFNNQLSQLILETIKEYTSLVSTTFDIPQKDLMALWTAKNAKSAKEGGESSTSAPPKKKVADDVDDSPEAVLLMKKTKAELAAMCKEKSYKVSGKKADLVARLLEKEVATTSTKKLAVSKKHESVLDVVRKNAPVIQIRKNVLGRLEDPETHLIFEGGVVVGKQNESGKVDDLTTEDIETCKQYKFKYNLPENLNKNDDLDDEQVDELDSDLDDEVSDIELDGSDIELDDSDLDGSDIESELDEYEE